MKLRGVGAAALVATTFVLAGCLPQPTRSIDLEARDVESIEIFIYPYGNPGAGVTRTLITNRNIVEGFVLDHTDVPGEMLDAVPDTAVGAEATDVVFNLVDGSTVELTRISLDVGDTINIWSDSEIQHALTGGPNKPYLDMYGVTTTVAPSLAPSVSD